MGLKSNLYMAVEITQVLANNNCTIKDADEIIRLLQCELSSRRFNCECGNVEAIKEGKKAVCADDIVITPLDHDSEDPPLF